MSLFFVVFSAAAPTQQVLNERDLASIIEPFAASRGFVAHFVERKSMALLAAPLVNEGTLAFLPPASLRRDVLKPHPSTMWVVGTRVVMQSHGQVKELDSTTLPGLEQLITGLLGLLRGDTRRLRQHYSLSAKGTGAQWTLSLQPHTSQLKKLIGLIEFVGNEKTVSSMRVVEANGDESTTTFTVESADKLFTDAEKQQLFTPAKSP